MLLSKGQPPPLAAHQSLLVNDIEYSSDNLLKMHLSKKMSVEDY